MLLELGWGRDHTFTGLTFSCCTLAEQYLYMEYLSGVKTKHHKLKSTLTHGLRRRRWRAAACPVIYRRTAVVPFENLRTHTRELRVVSAAGLGAFVRIWGRKFVPKKNLNFGLSMLSVDGCRDTFYASRELAMDQILPPQHVHQRHSNSSRIVLNC